MPVLSPIVGPRVRCTLRAHPRTSCGAIEGLVVEIGIEPGNVIDLCFEITGDIDGLRIPSSAAPLDPDRLWEHTCCELFVGPATGEGYVEYNFSPSGQAAMMEFSAYRQRDRSSPIAADCVSVARHSGQLQLHASVPVPDQLGDSIALCLTTVIEDAAGGLSYWALCHPCDQPDFHHRGGFALRCTLTPSPTIAEYPQEFP